MLSGVAGVLLVAPDWRTRALLRAQLLEEGLAVKAFESISDAAAALRKPAEEPGLIVLELSGSESAADNEQLSAWTRRMPVWAIAARSLSHEAGLQKYGFQAVLFRPLDVGELVERIKSELKPVGSAPRAGRAGRGRDRFPRA